MNNTKKRLNRTANLKLTSECIRILTTTQLGGIVGGAKSKLCSDAVSCAGVSCKED
jgi:hypothetical protein